MVIVLAVCTTYYETSIKRVRRNVRDDMAREVAKKGLKTEVESAAWINSFRQFCLWLIKRAKLTLALYRQSSASGSSMNRFSLPPS